MKFVIIDPAAAKVEKVEAKDLNEAFPLAGLKPGEVDFATLYLDEDGAGVSIVVYEEGLLLPVEEARYFSIGSHLFVGGAVLFAFNGARVHRATPTD